MTRQQLITSKEYIEAKIECHLFNAFGNKKPKVSKRLARYLAPHVMEIVEEVKGIDNTKKNKE